MREEKRVTEQQQSSKPNFLKISTCTRKENTFKIQMHANQRGMDAKEAGDEGIGFHPFYNRSRHISSLTKMEWGF